MIYNAPLMMLARAIILCAGYTEFSNDLCPAIACGSVHPIPLNSVGLYEVLLGSSSGRFDVTGTCGVTVSSILEAAHPVSSDLIFAGFFKMDKINSICGAHGIDFMGRYATRSLFDVWCMLPVDQS